MAAADLGKERFRYQHKEPEQPSASQGPPKAEQLDNGLLLIIENPGIPRRIDFSCISKS